MGQKIDTRSIGLDVGLSFIKWLTGEENLHYGYWDGLNVNAANLNAAQVAYTDRLFALLPDHPCRILDIGGGAGETARKLIALGHTVDIVVPSPFLASRCRENAPEATVHECMFEDFTSQGPFDVCLFSESYQYIPLDRGLKGCLERLTPEGCIIISDCFRTEGFRSADTVNGAVVGGGHWLSDFRALIAQSPVTVVSDDDITSAVAPSVEIEQGLFNVLGYALTRVDDEISGKRPKTRWAIGAVLNRVMSERRRVRLAQRLQEQTRNRDVFAANNHYLMMKLTRSA